VNNQLHKQDNPQIDEAIKLNISIRAFFKTKNDYEQFINDATA